MEEDDREDYDQYGSQSLKKQRVEVSLEMPQLPVPYSDDNKVYMDSNKLLSYLPVLSVSFS
jgi:RNA polymerase-associated protein LEO1